MEHFDPDSITQEQLHKFRSAAEAAWSDDTRHPDYSGHPQPSAGQCHVTSRWLQDKLGGFVGSKAGHYFWVSPDKQYAIDLTGDQFNYAPADPELEGFLQDEEDEPWRYAEHHKSWRPGPVLYKRSDHPLFKGFRIKEFRTEIPRVKLFKERANAALEGKLAKVAEFGWGGDAFPGEEPQAIERYHHDDPEPISGPEEYNFFYANGKLELSPWHDHDQLRQRMGVGRDYDGPMAVGFVRVLPSGRSEWTVASNLGRSILERAFDSYGRKAGWTLDKILDTSGNEVVAKRRIYYAYDEDDGNLLISKTAGDFASTFDIVGWADDDGETIRVKSFRPPTEVTEALLEYATDFGKRLAVGDNVIKTPEELELDNIYSLQEPPETSPSPQDDTKPNKSLVCPECGLKCRDWSEYITHRKDEQRLNEQPVDEGRFPEMDMDKTLKPHFHEQEPFVFPLASVRDMPEHLDRFWQAETDHHYGAYLNGELVGMATIEPTTQSIAAITALRSPEIVYSALVRKLQSHFNELDMALPSQSDSIRLARLGFAETKPGLVKWAAGKEPKDLIDQPVPFIFDIEKDQIFTGRPGSKTGDIAGKFTPGGIVEGFYEPGGKLVTTTQTDHFYSVRHMLDLWYWTYPHMRITGMESETADGNRTRLASIDVGSYIKTLAMADPAAWRAYKALKEVGGEVYVVGGAVRDALLGKQPNDIDLMVRGANPAKVRQTLNALPGKVDETGKDFGVFRYKHKGHEVEIALPRTERSTGDRRVDFDVDVDHTLPVEQDLLRRDFTVNSMAVSLDDGKLVDPYGGADDIANRRLRTTHPSSFQEDPTRLVRALVAFSKHGVTPDEATRAELEEHAPRLDLESRDRVGEEVRKLLKSPNPAGALRLAHEVGLLKHFLPEVADNFDFDQQNEHHNYPLGQHLLHVLEGVQGVSDDPDLRMAALLHDIGKPASQWIDPETGIAHYYQNGEGQGADHEVVGAEMAEARLRALRYPEQRIRRIKEIIGHHMFPAFSSGRGARKFLNRVGDHADDLLTLRHADMYGKGTDAYQSTKTPVDDMRELVQYARDAQAPTNINQLAIGGNELIQLGMKPGPAIGQMLQDLQEAVIEDPDLNTPEQLTQIATEKLVCPHPNW